MKLDLATLQSLFAFGKNRKKRDALVIQRLFWGAMAGCLASLLWAESPILESMELTTLEWRYQFSNMISSLFEEPRLSSDVSIVEFDDLSQFTLKIANFGQYRSQGILAKVLASIERGQPAVVVIDLDLRGAVNPELIQVIKRSHNVVVALFGSLEDGNELPASELTTHAAAVGYNDLTHEQNGLICRLPLTPRGSDGNDLDSLDQPGLGFVPSLTEATIDLSRKIKGVGPQSQLISTRTDQPIFIGFNQTKYQSLFLSDTLDDNFDPTQFKDRIVLIGSMSTPRRPELHRTPLAQNVPDVRVHAEAIDSLLHNNIIFSFPKRIAHHLLLLLGAVCGALSATFPFGKRTFALTIAAVTLIVSGQEFFSFFHLAIPIVPPLAVLILGFILGSFIHLDTDLRQRNHELAEARESMQVRAEEERQRIAEDLHDETLPALSAVARMADKLSAQMQDNPVPQEMRRKLDTAVIEMRRVINDLHPSVLETMGFKPALENLLSILSHDMEVGTQFEDMDGESDYNLSNFIKLQLYRIAQEALNNIQKHSQASQVRLSVGEKNNVLTIAVIDNGKGIDPKLIRPDSHGLLNVRQRAQLIDAKVEWTKPSIFPTGTDFRVTIPLGDTTENGKGKTQAKVPANGSGVEET
ncbi:MAG TPA: CHASE2 domain-containing protein [Oculatellaceae cyanobacterium]